MTAILQQFLSEARDFLQGISEKLLQLENAPADTARMGELFRLVHTLKGNCGLFDFPEMSRVLHAAEDLMVVVRDGDLTYSQALADQLLDAMDFVSLLLDEIEQQGHNNTSHSADSATLAQALRALIPAPVAPDLNNEAPASVPSADAPSHLNAAIDLPLAEVPESLRMDWYRQAGPNAALWWVRYTPEAECFFKGEDPFFQARQTPALAWQHISHTEPWTALANLDAYRCILRFDMVSTAPLSELQAHFRYVPEQVSITPLSAFALAVPVGDENGGPVYEDFVGAALAHLARGDLSGLARAARSMLELSAPGLWLASALRWLLLFIEHQPQEHGQLVALIESLRTFSPPVLAPRAETPKPTTPSDTMADSVIQAQMAVLGMSDQMAWQPGRIKACASTISACFRSLGREALLPALDAALAQALAQSQAAPLLAWLTSQAQAVPDVTQEQPTAQDASSSASLPPVEAAMPAATSPTESGTDSAPKFGRRAEDNSASPKTLKVEQEKIDRLMNLIGEMVVAKNGLPYLAARAEAVFGVRELAREIKTQYAVINRIAEEMQDTIMQVRMLPVSFVFQRFPRLVRDISRKLGKEVNLVLEGEDTEADKNIIEALADPLIHIVRNSLDHGIEMPDVRRAAGKHAAGQLIIRAIQEAGRVIIDIIDDGSGIDPAIIKRKAYAKGIIDESALERLTDQEAINLVFAAGFSTVEVVSDLSGRGVGMDVVRSAVERVNGTVTLESQPGQGTRLRLSLPLSMAVTNVMIIESNQQIFGVPMDMVVETVRIPRRNIHTIKKHQTAVLRGRIVPLRSLNELLATHAPQKPNDDDELATLVVRLQGENVGIVVDDFREVVDIILKPMGGILGGLAGYTGSALLGDGSVLMVLNVKELM
jgi:two-component system, chemotaxis family, sensor kinase CheA